MPETQRRTFSRIHFASGARLEGNGQWTQCEVRDLSLKGACVVVPPRFTTRLGDACTLELDLDEGEATVRMKGEIAHIEDARIGLVCRHIDLDSITHLRRMLELNLGGSALLERELSALLTG